MLREWLKVLRDDSYRPQIEGRGVRFAAAGAVTSTLMVVAGIAVVCLICWIGGGEVMP